jgi:1-acyl-sn-glycerol-3-phosphate acyltransferase
VVGFTFFLWTLASGAMVTALLAGFGTVVVLLIPDAAHRIPLIWSRALLLMTGVRVETTFEAPLPDGPVVLASNHQGICDIPALFVGLGRDRPFVYVAKKQVFAYPFIGWFLKAAGYVGVDRGNHAAALQNLEKAGERIREGTSIMVFPEGTRSHDEAILPFKKRAFHVAMRAGVPIVPIALEGSLQVSPKRRWYVCPNTVHIRAGVAYPLSGMTDGDRERVVAEVRTRVSELHRQLVGLGGGVGDAVAAPGLAAFAATVRTGEIR